MTTRFSAALEIGSAMKEMGLTGALSLAKAYPAFATASDFQYTLLSSGNVAAVFSAESFANTDFRCILSKLPEPAGLQVYTHHVSALEQKRYLALSAKVPYERPYSPFREFAKAFKRGELYREICHLHQLTEETFASLRQSVEGEGLTLLPGIAPILSALGPIRINDTYATADNAALDVGAVLLGDPTIFNLSFLRLGPARLSLLIELNAFPNPKDEPLPMPGGDTEYLGVTCIHKPNAKDAAKYSTQVEGYLRFLRFFKRTDAPWEESFPGADSFTQEGLPKEQTVAKHFLLLFGSSLSSLRKTADEYITRLSEASVSFHASMIRTKENYGALFPGHFPCAEDGILLPLAKAAECIKVLHP